MNFFDKYNESINYFYDHILKEELINSFIRFYGEKHKYKIRNVIDNLIMIRVQPNLGKNKFQKKVDFYLSKLKKEAKCIFSRLDIFYREDTLFIEIERLLHLSNGDLECLIAENELNEELKKLKLFWYKYSYYKGFLDKDLKNNLFVTGRNVETNKYDYLIDEIDDEMADGVAFMEINSCFLIAPYGYGFDLSVLIHEINHLLSKDLLFDLGNGNFLTQSGFRNSGDLFYEIINDYMSIDVFKDLNSRLNHDFDFILKRDNYCSGYLEIDEICHYPIRSIYNMAKELILESLINGNGNKFIKVIGKNNYAKVILLLQECYSSVISQLMKNPRLKIEEFVLDNEKYDLFDECLSDIYNQLFAYVDYNENLEKQINTLENNGTVRRL